MNYLVSWTIDIEDADNPVEAAKEAAAVLKQINPDSQHFYVRTQECSGEQVTEVDLADEENWK